MRRAKPLACRNCDPHIQKAVMALLEESPMPWTTGMLAGEIKGCNTESLDLAAMACRIWKMETGVWAAAKYRDSEFVTDELLEKRFGFRL